MRINGYRYVKKGFGKIKAGTKVFVIKTIGSYAKVKHEKEIIDFPIQRLKMVPETPKSKNKHDDGIKKGKAKKEYIKYWLPKIKKAKAKEKK